MNNANCDKTRAVSSPLGYLLNLGLAAIVLVSMGTVGLAVLDTNEETAIEADLTVYGQQLAGEIQEVDRLARAAGPGKTVSERAALDDLAREDRYTVTIANASHVGVRERGAGNTPCDRPCLILETQDGSIQVTVNVVSETPLQPAQFDGGPVTVSRPATAERIQFDPLDA